MCWTLAPAHNDVFSLSVPLTALCACYPWSRTSSFASIVCLTALLPSPPPLPLAASHQRGERRPSLEGSRRNCHAYRPELSGTAAPPSSVEPSSPAITVSMHPIGGCCAVSRKMPMLPSTGTEVTTNSVGNNGLNPCFDTPVYCVAAEPHSCFVRFSVVDTGHPRSREQEVAYDVVVLGRLRRGYRVLQLRSELGTRIELCYLLVCIRCKIVDSVSLWATPQMKARQVWAVVDR